MPEKRKVKYDLEDRLLEHSVNIVKIAEGLPKTSTGNHIAGQLPRSGTSPYANHGEAQAAESSNEFIHKMRICLKELRESKRWLKLIQRQIECLRGLPAFGGVYPPLTNSQWRGIGLRQGFAPTHRPFQSGTLPPALSRMAYILRVIP